MQDKKLSLIEKLSYSGGDIASCITFGTISSYLSYYYTDIAGISLAAVGIILGVARVLEAGANLFTGIAIDKTNSHLGKSKPYMYYTTIPLMLSFFLVFIVPDISPRGKTLFAFVTYLLFCLLYAVNNTAYGTLLSMVTPDLVARKKLNGFKLIGCSSGTLIASLCTLPLVSLLGNGGHYQFALTALLYAVISLFFMTACVMNVKERTTGTAENLSIKESLRCASKSPSWILLCIINLLAFLANTLRGQSTIYYAKYCLGKESLASILLTLATIAALMMAPFMAKILMRIGSRNCMMAGHIVYIVFSVCTFLAKDNLVLLILFTLLSGIGCNLIIGPSYTLCTDTMDEAEYHSGKRPQGIMTSVMMCTMKLGIAGTGFVFSIVLNLGGYVSDAIQTPSAINAICWNMFWIPILLTAINIVLTCFFRLDKNHAQIIQSLQNSK